jgi:hypothetical protein
LPKIAFFGFAAHRVLVAEAGDAKRLPIRHISLMFAICQV